jgi:hypothetical protein
LSAQAAKSSYQDLSWDQVKKLTIDKIKQEKTLQKNNLFYQMNRRIQKIEDSKRTEFILKSPRVVDIYLRESYTILEKDFVIKNAPVWKKVLIKQKNIWDY